MQFPGLQEHKHINCKASLGMASEYIHDHFCCILPLKAIHKASCDTRDEETGSIS